MKRISLILVALCLFMGLNGQIVLDTPHSDRVTGYSIDVELLTDLKIVKGSMEAFWVNPSSEDVGEVQLHMYLNAFRSNKSTFYKGTGGSPGNKDIDFGWVDISSISDLNGNDLFQNMTYIQPDDGNKDDMTVLKIDLDLAISPGDTLWLSMEFESKLPSNIRRTGFSEDYFFVAQWFPKFGVYETAGMRYAEVDGWNCHQFHNNSEFYANHSVYDVSITLPEEYVIGSGGMLIREEVLEEGKMKFVYRAEDIVDFAWTAWPEYLVATDKWEHVDIRLLYSPGRENQVERQITAVKYALEYFRDHIGPYPWPHLTFVDPPSIGAGAGGMEYTTIFTSASSYNIPEFVLLPEMVTIHEFGHAYFMGILASNEFEEPWIDEGINSYIESRIMDHYYGPEQGIINHEKFGVADRSMQRLSYVLSEDRMVTDNTPSSWEYPHGTYGMMSYNKAATWLWTLQGILGEETIDVIFKEFYNEWGFDHPSAEDFVDLVNRVVVEERGNEFGENMDWFFEQTLYGTGICDYKVDGISNMRQRSFKGIMKSDTGMVLREDSTDGDSLILSTVRLQRLGEVMLPIEVLVHFENGDEVLEKWDGKARYKNFKYSGTNKVVWAKADPHNKITMDVNFVNNSYTTEPDRVPVKSFFRKISVFSQFFIQLITL
jgi:hypothetical protein